MIIHEANREKHEGASTVQLKLNLFGSDRLREAMNDYLATQCDGLADATFDDYEERARWLCRAFGEFTKLDALTYQALCQAVRVWGPQGKGHRQVTLKKRLVFLRAVLKHAHGMGWCGVPPELPRLRDDGERGKVIHTRGQFVAFRLALPEGVHRDLATLAYWTGMHRSDLFTTRRRHFDLNYDWGVEGRHKGAFLRRNHKNPRIPDSWMPLEAEAIKPIADMLSKIAPDPEALLTGKVWNISRTFYAAADRAEVPRISLIRLRSTFATRLLSDGYPHEYVRLALGHTGEVRADGSTKHTTPLTRHYARWSPDMVQALPPLGQSEK